jgi:hypothetical protein
VSPTSHAQTTYTGSVSTESEAAEEKAADVSPIESTCWCGAESFRDGWLCEEHAADRLRKLGVEPRWERK